MTKSISGIHWYQKPYDERLKTAIYQRYGLSEALSSVLAAKQIQLDEVENFLNPRIKTALPNPFDLLDMDVAVDHVLAAIGQNVTITYKKAA